MKTVLIVDASPMLRNFLVMKLEEHNIRVESCESQRDAFTKTISLLPDLIIGDISDDSYSMTEYLDRKHNNPNSKDIPVVLCGPVIPNDQIQDFVSFGVVKYFNKPVRFDVFFAYLGRLVGTVFSMDTTPCILEMHLNDEILFIEVAQGLNRDKLSLLKYKIPEILDKAKLNQPKIIIMLTDLNLSFTDGINLETLLTAILSDRRVKARNVKVLSFDSFTKDLIEGHNEYREIDVANNLQKVLTSVVKDADAPNIVDLIHDKVLTSTSDVTTGTIGMSYNPAEVVMDSDDDQQLESETGISSLAIIDPDQNTQNLIKEALPRSTKISVFATAADFLSTIEKQHYDVIVLEINLQGMTGLDALKVLQGKHYTNPILVYSAISDKTVIYKAISLGARTYLVKPQKPEAIVKKLKDVIKQEF